MANPSTIEKILEQARQEYSFSAYQLVTECPGKSLSLAKGILSYWENQSEVTPQSFFDLASLTKPICTVSVLARLVDRKLLEVEWDLEKVAPEWKGSLFGKLKICDLLSHCAGLIDWYPFFQKKSWKEELLLTPEKFLVRRPREKTQYSDVGFLLLGSVIENVLGSVKDGFEIEVVKPLKLKQVQFGAVAKENSVATEWSTTSGTLLQGKVFDENAFGLGGVAPHAGLFSSAEALRPFCREWLNSLSGKSDWLSKATAEMFVKRTLFIADSSWALGWDTRSFIGSSAGSLFSTESFGHLGYTGTSVWIDPVAKGFCIFLTNRVHPSRLDERIRRIRPLIHDEVYDFWRT